MNNTTSKFGNISSRLDFTNTGWLSPAYSGSGGASGGYSGSIDNIDTSGGGGGGAIVSQNTPCNCFTGTPFLDSTGNCRCSSDSINNTPVPVKTSSEIPVINGSGQVIYYANPLPNNTQVFSLPLAIKNNPVIALIGVGVLALMLLKK